MYRCSYFLLLAERATSIGFTPYKNYTASRAVLKNAGFCNSENMAINIKLTNIDYNKIMIKTFSYTQKKKILIDLLNQHDLDPAFPSRLEEISRTLSFSQHSVSLHNLKQQLADWIIENLCSNKVSAIECLSRERMHLLSTSSKDFITLIFKNYLKKIDPKSNQPFYGANDYAMKNPYMNYPIGMSYLYPNQPYMMGPGPMYSPNYQADQQNYESLQKFYKLQHQYYMQMPMQWPFNNPYSIPENYGVAKYPYSHPSPQPAKNQIYPIYGQSKSVQSAIQKQANRESNFSSTRSVEEYEENFKRYQQMYGKNLPSNAPFIIIPPSQQGKRAQIPQKLRQQDKSSEIEVIEKFQVNKKMNNINLGKRTVETGQYNAKFKNCSCKGYGSQAYFVCVDCNENYHYACLEKEKKSQGEERVKKQVCSFCFMRQIDPLNEVSKVIREVYIKKINEEKVVEVCNFQLLDEYIMPKGSQYEIELRCMKLEDASNEIADYTWPDECIVTLNGEKAIQFPALQHNSSIKKRKDMSVFLANNIFNYTKYFQLRANSKIGLEIKSISIQDQILKKMKNDYSFIFGIYLTRKKTVDELYEEVIQDPSNKINFIEKYFVDPIEDEEVEIQQIKVSLLDPFTWDLIDTPARGVKCVHGQCFDLKTYLVFMSIQKSRNWKCPICSRECRKFVMDLQQLEVIKQFKKHEGDVNLSKQVTFHRNGRTLFNVQNESQCDADENNAIGEGIEMDKNRTL